MITKGLSARAQIAYTNETDLREQRYVRPEMYYATTRRYTGELGLYKSVNSEPVKYTHEDSQYYKLHFETMINYDRLFGDDHHLTGLLYYYMSDEQTMNKDIDGKDESLRSMYAIPIRYQGLSGRVTYGFRDTYFMDLNFGYTGSANFAKGDRFGFFPAVALGWVPTGYDWVREKMPWLNFLKIRGSFGTVGNDRLTDRRFPYLTLLKTGAGGGWGSTDGYITEETIGADNLRWEVAKKTDIGIEGRLFDEAFSFTVDWFLDKRDGIYQERQQIPDYVGLQQMPFGNVGKMKSYGADGNFAYTHDINKDMSFTIRGNFTYSANKVENWEQAVQKYDYQNYSGFVNNAFRGYIALGLFRDEADIAASPRQTFGDYMPGDIKYKDVNGDGVINEDDKVPLSYPNYPRLMYGFGGEFRYKNLTVGVLFKGTGNTDYYYVDDNGYWDKGKNGEGYIPFYGGKTGNVLKIVADQKNRWTPASYSGDPSTENPNAKFPRLSYGKNENNSQFSTFWHANSRYLRLQEVSVNYNLPAGKVLKYLGVRSLDLQFVAGVETLQQFYHSTYDRFGMTNGLTDILYDAYDPVKNPNTMQQAIWLFNGGHAGQDTMTDSQWVANGSYLRANLIQLGYTFDSSQLEKTPFSSLRIYFNVNNAFLITSKDFNGYDPEATSQIDTSNGVVSAAQFGQNMAFFSYPRARTFTLGVNVAF